MHTEDDDNDDNNNERSNYEILHVINEWIVIQKYTIIKKLKIKKVNKKQKRKNIKFINIINNIFLVQMLQQMIHSIELRNDKTNETTTDPRMIQ